VLLLHNLHTLTLFPNLVPSGPLQSEYERLKTEFFNRISLCTIELADRPNRGSGPSFTIEVDNLDVTRVLLLSWVFHGVQVGRFDRVQSMSYL